ncbi:MAG TPA: hypothetical protein VKR05_01290, partial [Candidatus Cybelea sp.]|nr:hypothetical protein [Candidatus Cybelea sp.]
MNARFTLPLASVLAAASMAPSPVSASLLRSHTVREILVDGRAVATVTGVTLTRGTLTAHTLQRGERIADGTRIDVPAHVAIVVVSTGEKSTTTLQPGASVTFVSTGSGELVSSNRG